MLQRGETEMKKFLIILLLTTGCDKVSAYPTCIRNNSLRAELFDKCMMRAAEARNSGAYTTHENERYDKVINACDTAAWEMSIINTPCRSN